MSSKLLLTNMFLAKLFKFYFIRNKKIFIALINLTIFFALSLAYIVLFVVKLPSQIQKFKEGFGLDSYLIIILIMVLLLDGYFIYAALKLSASSKKIFYDEINQSFPLNSTYTVTLEGDLIQAKNSIVLHIDSYDISDIAWYYQFSDLLILQAKDDKMILIDKKEELASQIKRKLKENNIKKRIILMENVTN